MLLVQVALGVGVIGHHNPVEGPGESCRYAVARFNLLSPGEAQGLFHSEGAGETRVEGPAGVYMLVAPERPGRKLPVRIRRKTAVSQPLGRLDLSGIDGDVHGLNRGWLGLVLGLHGQGQADKHNRISRADSTA